MRVAFCAPFYGERAAGGAEAECRVTAEKLQQAGVDVDVFTTCLLDLQHDWNVPFYPEGISQEGGVTVHRFRSEKSSKIAFAELNQRVLSGGALSGDEQKQYLSLSVVSERLLKELDRRRDDFDWVCFIPYLFGLTYFGVRLLGEKAVLIPCLHDEAYARLPAFGEMFKICGRIVFHTQAEQTLAHKLYDYDSAKDRLIGEGVPTEFESDGHRFRERFGITKPFLLSAGRKHESKNTPDLVRAFQRYKRDTPDSDLQLILIGPDTIPLPQDSGVIDLGYVSLQDKRDAYAAACVFCQPSQNESFSIVLMEAWDCQTPVLVHEDCAVTREHVVRSQGGLFYRTHAEFAACVNWMLENQETATGMGQAGREYVRSNYAWPTIIDRYQNEVFKESSV